MSKYLLVIDQIGHGGAEKILVDFKKYLVANGHQVFVFVLYANGLFEDSSCLRYGLRVSNTSNLVNKYIQQRLLMSKLESFAKDVLPDRIFSFLERSNSLVASLKTNAQKVLSVHNVLSIQYDKINNIIVKKMTKKIIQIAYNSKKLRVLAVSEQVKEDLIDNFSIERSQIFVINNRVDKSLILELAELEVNEFYFDPAYKYILNVGRFTLQKAQWKLVKAVKHINKIDPDNKIRLLLIGNGEYKQKLQDLISKLELNEQIALLPFNINPYKFMKRANLIVMPSLYEGFPITIAECAALSKAFVGSNKAIPHEMFKDRVFYDSITYSNIDFSCDFTSEIGNDEIELANKILYNIDNNIITSMYDSWNKDNNKQQQFYEYCQLFEKF